MIPDKEREALMRLTMCARHQCAVCKYHNKYTQDDCENEITDDMHILADALEKTMDLLEKIEKSNEEIDKLMADSPLNGW